MKALAGGVPRRSLFRRPAELQLSPIKEMELRAARIPGIVSLAQGIPSFDTPQPIQDYVREKIASGACSRYSLTPGLPKLREMIAEALLREGMRYDPESEVIVSCGAIEAISATLLAALDPGDEVILPSPSYPSYREAILIAGGVPVYVPLVEEDNFALDTEEIERAINRRTAAILYANPNNPTGTIYTRAQVEQVAALAEAHGLLLVTDEVYKDFLYNHVELFTPARLEAIRERVVRIFSFSKAYGMTGWRVGFLHSDRRNVAEILKVHDALVTCAPVASQYAAMAALELGEEFVETFRHEFRERRDRTLEHLDALSMIFDYQKPNASYFVFPRVKDVVPFARDSRRLALEILDHARVALVPGIAFGPTGESHLRISYSRKSEEIDQAFERLSRYFLRTEARGPRPTVAERPLEPFGPRPAPWARGRARTVAVAYLNFLARTYLARVRPRCIAIAGLQGKTVMKRWLRAMLQPSLRVRANPRSYNTEIGLPLAILDAPIEGDRPSDVLVALLRATSRGVFAADLLDVLILEMGIRCRGDARALLHAMTPAILVVTPLAPSFTSDLSFLDVVENEIAFLAREVAAHGGQIIACLDDPRLAGALDGVTNVRSILREQITPVDHHLALEVQGRRYEVELDVVGESSQYALLAGIEIATILGLEDQLLRELLKGQPPATPS